MAYIVAKQEIELQWLETELNLMRIGERVEDQDRLGRIYGVADVFGAELFGGAASQELKAHQDWVSKFGAYERRLIKAQRVCWALTNLANMVDNRAGKPALELPKPDGSHDQLRFVADSVLKRYKKEVDLILNTGSSLAPHELAAAGAA